MLHCRPSNAISPPICRGERYVCGTYFLRPCETRHEPRRRFYPNEVMRWSRAGEYPLKQVLGKASVIDAKTAARGRYRQFTADETFICEFRVNTQRSQFSKIKDDAMGTGKSGGGGKASKAAAASSAVLEAKRYCPSHFEAFPERQAPRRCLVAKIIDDKAEFEALQEQQKQGELGESPTQSYSGTP